MICRFAYVMQVRIMRYIAIIFLFTFQSCVDSTATNELDSVNGDSATSVTIDSSGVGGVYSFGSNPEIEAVGSLIVVPESDTTFLFSLDFNRGAPSYNMGSIASRAHYRNQAWIYSHSEPDELETCEIEFMFSRKFVQLVTRQKGCGFGANVIVDHIYDRTSLIAPLYFIGGEGDTVYFSNLAKAVK